MMTRQKATWVLVLAGLVSKSVLGCGAAVPGAPPTAKAQPARPAPPALTPAHGSAASLARETPVAKADTPKTPDSDALPGQPPDVAFGELFDRLSEPGRYYFSHNYVTNETSYLQVARVLAERAAQGQAFIGVGPEQNFTYIGLTRPSVAFVVDIRRRNALLHLWYKAIFDDARTRTHFLSLLLSRPYAAGSDPGDQASIEQVLSAVERQAPDKSVRDQNRVRMLELIEKRYGVRLKEKDHDELRETQAAFFESQLEISFEVLVKNARKRAPLREILTMRDPQGQTGGFLADERQFRYVQRMQREHRIVPVVGDFAGDRALRGIAEYLRAHQLTVSVFYASNVEEYLLDGRVFRKWADNIAALPSDGRSLFVRAFLERKHHVHRAQQKHHRVATFAQPMAGFLERQRQHPYRNWVEVSYDPAPLYASAEEK